MLTGLLGIRLFLWIGSPIPTPPPASLLNAVTQVSVTDSANKEDAFEISFAVGKDSLVEYDLLSEGALSPMTRVLIGVVFGVTPETILDGVITRHEFTPSNEPGTATLRVSGSDISVLLDLEDRSEQYQASSDSDIFKQIILQRYGLYGIKPDAPRPTPFTPTPVQFTPNQAKTDLRFIQDLARRNGYVFYIQPPSVAFPAAIRPTTAYFGPENRLGVPQDRLAINMGPSTNVNTLSFGLDALAQVNRPASFIEPISRQVIPVPALPPVNIPPLAPTPLQPNRTERRRGSAKESAPQAIAAAAAAATSMTDPLVGRGELDGLIYGHVLRAGGIVGVQGAGFSHDGIYKVDEVTHTIAPGSYTQRFTLKREGTGSISPVV